MLHPSTPALQRGLRGSLPISKRRIRLTVLSRESLRTTSVYSRSAFPFRVRQFSARVHLHRSILQSAFPVLNNHLPQTLGLGNYETSIRKAMFCAVYLI